MKTIVFLVFALLIQIGACTAAFSQESGPPSPAATSSPAPPAPTIETAPRGMTAEEFETKALKWVSALGTVGVAVLMLVAMLWQRIIDIRSRMDRQSIKTGSIETRLTAVAMATPQGTEALRNAPADPTPPEPPGYVPSRLAIAIIGLSTAAAFGFAACATNTGDPETDARGRATNQALVEAARVLGNVATSALFNAASAEMDGGNADYMQAAAQGMYANMDAATGYKAVKNVITAYSGGRAPRTASIAGTIAEADSPPSPRHPDVNAAIASVIYTAAGTPPR